MIFHPVDVDLPNHKKSRRLALLLSERRAWTRIVELWLWADLYALDGDLSEVSGQDLAHAMGYRVGDSIPMDLKTALIQSGFLNENCQLHAWAERAKHLKTKRLAMRKLRASRGVAVTPLLPLGGVDVTPERERESEREIPPLDTPHCLECERVGKALEDLSGVAVRWTDAGHVEKLHTRHLQWGPEKCLDVVRVVVPRLMRDDEFKRFARVDTLFGVKNFTKYLDEVALSRSPRHDPSGTPQRRDPNLPLTPEEQEELKRMEGES